MAKFRDGAGLVAIATGGEGLTTYGGGDTLTHLLYVDRASAAAALQPTLVNKSRFATGSEESKGQTIVGWEGSLPLSGPVCDKSLPILLSFALGSDTRSAVDSGGASLHTIAPVGAGVELNSTVIEVKNTSASDTSSSPGRSFKFAGCVVDSLTISGDEDSKEWNWSATFAHAGKDEGGAGTDLTSLTKPVLYPFSWAGTQVVWFSTVQTTAPTFDDPTSAVAPTGGWSSGVDWSPYIRSGSINIGNAVQRGAGYNASGKAHRANRTMREQTVNLRMHFDDAAATVRLLPAFGDVGVGSERSGALIIYNRQNVLVGSTFHHGFAFYYPKVSMVSCTPPSGSPREIDTQFLICDNDSGEQSVHAAVWNASTEGDYL
jgi:hypothetical protein